VVSNNNANPNTGDDAGGSPKDKEKSASNPSSNTSNSRPEISQPKTNANAKESSESDKHWLDYATAIFAFIAAVGAIFAAIFSGWQASVAEDTEKRQLRAYVIVKSAAFAKDDSGKLKFGRQYPGGKELLIYYTVSNEGVTPAYDVFRQITVEYPFANRFNFDYTDGTAAYVSKEHTFGPIITRAFSDEEVSDILKGGEDGGKLLVFAGRITYKDIFERPWPTFFCFAYLASPEPKFTLPTLERQRYTELCQVEGDTGQHRSTDRNRLAMRFERFKAVA
jgi:hypothetical protein